MTTPQYTRRSRGYAHPRRLNALQVHFNTLVTIERKTNTQDEFGQEIVVYIPDQTLSVINAYKEPQTAGAGERREDDQTVVINRWQIYLKGYYPTLRVEDRAIADGVPHNILNVAHDDSKTLTMLITEIINPSSDAIIPT